MQLTWLQLGLSSQSVLQRIYDAVVTCLISDYCLLQAQRNLTGIMNYTNPGAVSHNEILQMYKDYIDPEFNWSNFSVEEQAKVIVAARSNNLLDTKRVRHMFAFQMKWLCMQSPFVLLCLCTCFLVCQPVFGSIKLQLPVVFQPQVCCA